MLLSVNRVIREIELKHCQNGVLSDDIFDEVEVNIPDECEELESGAFEISKRDFENTVSYWKGQVDDYNTYGDSQELGYGDGEDDYYILYVDGNEFRGY